MSDMSSEEKFRDALKNMPPHDWSGPKDSSERELTEFSEHTPEEWEKIKVAVKDSAPDWYANYMKIADSMGNSRNHQIKTPTYYSQPSLWQRIKAWIRRIFV